MLIIYTKYKYCHITMTIIMQKMVVNKMKFLTLFGKR